MATAAQLTPNEFDDACLAAVLKGPQPTEEGPAELTEPIGNTALQAAREALAERDSERWDAQQEFGPLGVAERDDEVTRLRQQVEFLGAELEALRSREAPERRSAERDGREAELASDLADALAGRRAVEARVAELEEQLVERDGREAAMRRDLDERDDAATRLREAFDALKGDTDRLLSEISSSLL